MSQTDKKIMVSAFAVVFLVVGLLYLLGPIDKAAANPSTISQPGVSKLSTSSASSTPTFMTPGTATTTLTLDTINKYATTTLTPLVSDGDTNATAVDDAWLALQMTGSSTASQLKLTWEYSNDGIDFYRDTSTSTIVNFASSTDLGIGGRSSNLLPTHKQTGVTPYTALIKAPAIPARYLRAVLTVPAGGSNSTNWAQFFTRQQR